MREKIICLYEYDELNDTAKERARQWLAELVFSDSSDWELVYEDAERVAEILGISFDQRAYQTLGGATRYEPAIYFSGFASQGDGACFEGSYAYAKGAAKRIKEYASKDKELHRIAQELQDLQKKHGYALTASVKHTDHHYCHKYTTTIEVDHDAGRNISIEDQEALAELLRDFMQWIYKQLQAEYDYQTSEEALEDAIVANGYTFTEDGKRED